MRNLIAPAALILALSAGSAFAAAPPAKPMTAAKPAATAKVDVAAKRTACETAWKAQKTHTGKEADFVKACIAKG